ncbi:MAG: hypothetical protein HUJ98_01435 [Bacteroidaceae bacterium]|nr:hypothetical protein [Bacteroidaceae bacterium]
MIEALLEIGNEFNTDIIIDFISGKQNDFIEEQGLNEMETFGIGENEDESIWEQVISQAITDGYLSEEINEKKSFLCVTASGKKFLKSPVSFKIEGEGNEDEEDENVDTKIDSNIQHLMQEIENEHDSKPAKTPSKKKSTIKIELIHAIDRQKDLDEFAVSQGKDFLEVLDELESIIKSGMKLNIDYFINEVLEEDQVDEIIEHLQRCNGNVQKVMAELEDSYNEDEIRLVNIKFLTQVTKK